ncbi:MAG: hypothetical protein LKJ13_05510 [Clostridia bacterium]|jgi:macrodomain Ter protein organizer (MatP/YcbG family)|nr:hypothetical protein [Clostridia bacterium]MCI2001210.1 hypothetical protein [Clostridia bacterium]MCI2015922.1 hypothetical protein [Clostridia bacterium]
MAEKIKKAANGIKKTAKSVKKITVSFEKEYYQELSSFAAQKGMTVEEFAKKAVQEKFDSDRISNMIDSMLQK